VVEALRQYKDDVAGTLAPQGAAYQPSTNLEGKRLSHLDLSGLDFSSGNLRLAKLNAPA
jgi:uncharacterized protein YjbI with pentapeptide repeats